MGQVKIPATPAGTSLAGKTALITGASSGLGLETARQYLLLGVDRLIITARTAQKGQEAIATLRADAQVAKINPNATIDAYELELEDYSSVVRFCQKVKTEVPQLHVLLNNAGMSTLSYHKTKNGHERSLQVHVYSPIHIATTLLPLLQRTAHTNASPTHLTFTGSTMHRLSKLPSTLHASTTPTPLLPHLALPTSFSSLTQYPDSKLLLALAVRRLALSVSQPGSAPQSDGAVVVINHVCPGLVRTGLDRGLPVWLKPVMDVYRLISARGVDEGARTIVWASVVVGREGGGGVFVSDNLVREDAENVTSEAAQKVMEKLWEELEVERRGLGL